MEDDAIEFGQGYDFESGAYPTPPNRAAVEPDPHLIDYNKPISPDRERKVKQADDSDDEEIRLDTFRGIVLGVSPEHDPRVFGNDVDADRAANIFLGNGTEFIRVSLWNDAVENVKEYLDAGPETVLEVQGKTNKQDGWTDYHIFDESPYHINEVEDDIIFKASSIGAKEITAETPVITTGSVIDRTLTREVTPDDGSPFKAQAFVIAQNNEKVYLNAYDDKTNEEITRQNELCVLIGWPDDTEFVTSELNDYEFNAKIKASNYSCICTIDGEYIV